MHQLQRTLRATALIAALVGCQYEDPVGWIGSECFLGSWNPDDTCTGTEVDATTLNYGQEQYLLYCMACHGIEGDGRGPASRYLRPPPRDLRIAAYKFAKVVDGLPHDEDLARIINDGLLGTAMHPWEDIPPPAVNAIVQYIKTFSPPGEGWFDPDGEQGTRMVAGGDPWAGKEAAGIQSGREIYHALQCWSCHPAYASPNDIRKWTAAIKGTAVGELRPNLYYPEAKTSELYTVGWPSLPECETDEQCESADQKCVFGRCEVKLKIKPPDFMFDAIRAGATAPELFSTIAAGINGSGMPQWKETIPDEQIWAMAHYVNWLTGWKGTAQAVEMKNRLRHVAKTEPAKTFELKKKDEPKAPKKPEPKAPAKVEPKESPKAPEVPVKPVVKPEPAPAPKPAPEEKAAPAEITPTPTPTTPDPTGAPE